MTDNLSSAGDHHLHLRRRRATDQHHQPRTAARPAPGRHRLRLGRPDHVRVANDRRQHRHCGEHELQLRRRQPADDHHRSGHHLRSAAASRRRWRPTSTATTTPTASPARPTPKGRTAYTYDNANELTGVTERHSGRVVHLRPQRQPDRDRLQHHRHERDDHLAGNTYTYDNAGNMISANNGHDDHDLYV